MSFINQEGIKLMIWVDSLFFIICVGLIRAVAIHDSMDQESIQNPTFQVKCESMIRQNWRTLVLKESIHESRIGLKSLLFSES